MASSVDQRQKSSQDIYSSDSSQVVTVAFQGVRGAFGDEAAQAYFAREGLPIADPSSYPSFADVFRAVAIGETDYGVVPIENSQAGSINDVYDLLRQHDLYVIGEIGHRVNQCLLCLPGQKKQDIKRVLSHPQGLAQCEEYLRDWGVETVATYNTAGSAKMVHEEQLAGVAAIASAAIWCSKGRQMRPGKR